MVKNVTISPTSSGDGFELSWQPPSGRCQANKYKIQHQLNLLDQCETNESEAVVVGETSSKSFTVTGLLGNSMYSVLVIASNDAGDSAGVTQTVATTEICK